MSEELKADAVMFEAKLRMELSEAADTITALRAGVSDQEEIVIEQRGKIERLQNTLDDMARLNAALRAEVAGLREAFGNVLANRYGDWCAIAHNALLSSKPKGE